MKTLVVFYSRTGTTKKVAEDIAKLLNADKEEIIDLRNREGAIGWLASGRDAMKKKLTEIRATKKDPKKYDLVVIGTPIWAGNLPPATRMYTHCNKDKFGRVACFCTMGGDNPGKVFSELKKITGKNPIATLHAKASFVNKNLHKDILGDFIKKIKENSKKTRK
jgi:flavodoxin